MKLPTLLGYLARFASLTSQSEVLCTQALAYLLHTYAEARSALAEVVACTGVEIPLSVQWVPEARLEDGARPDLEARTTGEIPVVMIEAKLGAQLFPDQLQIYAEDLRKRNRGHGALLVLVPTSRRDEAIRVTTEAFEEFGLAGSSPWPVSDECRTGFAVISWKEIFDAIRASGSERLCLELDQLEDMYHELSSDFIAPVASGSDLRAWKSSETDFFKLFDQVTSSLTKQHGQPKLLPKLVESFEPALPDAEPVEHYFRYVCPCASCYSVGVRDPFAGFVTPVWMRFHKDTSGFRDIRRRIESSRADSVLSHGHLWIPLHVPPDVSGEEMVQQVAKQVEAIERIALNKE